MQRFLNVQIHELRLGTAQVCRNCGKKARVEYQVTGQSFTPLCVQHAQAAMVQFFNAVGLHETAPLPDSLEMRAVEDAALASPLQPSGIKDIEAGLRASGLTGGMAGLRKANPGLASEIERLARQNRGEADEPKS